jgi:hypothetical protein
VSRAAARTLSVPQDDLAVDFFSAGLEPFALLSLLPELEPEPGSLDELFDSDLVSDFVFESELDDEEEDESLLDELDSSRLDLPELERLSVL